MRGLYLITLCVGLTTACGLTEAADVEGAHARQRVILGKMTDEAFAKMTLKFLASDEIILGDFIAYESKQDRLAAGPQGFDHCSYGLWRAFVDSYARSHSGCPAVKEAVKIGSTILIRTVRPNCQRTRRILQGGADPLRLDVNGRDIEILTLQLGPLTSAPNENRVAATVYARARSGVSPELARALTTHLIRLTGIDTLSVKLRRDAWFATDCGFPAVYAFEDRGRIPTFDQIVGVSAAFCTNFATGGEVHCSGSTDGK